MSIRKFLVSIIALFLLTGCEPAVESLNQSSNLKSAESASPSARTQVIAVSYPLEYLTQRIVGDRVAVLCLVPAGTRGSQWRPTRDDIVAMQAADLIVANGLGATYAHWLETISLPDSKVCNSASRGLGLTDYISVEDIRTVHSHGPEGEHSHPMMVANTWLDPSIASKQADYIAKELTRVFPTHTDVFQKNLAALKSDLWELTKSLAEIKSANPELKSDEKQKKSQPEIVFTTTPDLKFLTRGIGWDDQHFNWFDPPSQQQLESDLKKTIAAKRVIERNGKRILLSSQPLPPTIIAAVEAANMKVILIDCLDQRPLTGDYLSVMRANFEALR